jgi:hypothetical protein
MKLIFILPVLVVLVLELVAVTTIIRKFKSPYALGVAIVALFIVNIMLYSVIIHLWISQTVTTG